MSEFTFDDSAPAAGASNQSSSGFTFANSMPSGIPDQGSFSSTDWMTGQNREGTANGWGTPFFQQFSDGYRRASEDGTAGKYFLNRGTGIAFLDQEGTDDAGQSQVVRAGDVFSDGAKVGNVYDRYGKAQGDLIVSQAGWLDANEVRHGVTVDEKRASVQDTVGNAESSQAFQRKVDDYKQSELQAFDEQSIVGAGLAAAALGAGVGAAVGTPFFGVGAGVGAALGGAGGFVVGAYGAWANQDQLKDQWARGKVQEQMLREQSNEVAARALELQNLAGLASEWMSPLKQAVQGTADLGGVGDDKSEFYRTDPSGQSTRGLGWTVAGFAAGLGDATLQFASPLGRAAYMLQMSGTIAGKTGALATSGGLAFDDRSGSYDNVFYDDDGTLNVGTGAAALGNIGIDVVQLGMGRGLDRLAKFRAQDLTGRRVTEAGMKFNLAADGTVASMSRMPSVTVLAPSELVQSVAVRAAARMKAVAAGGEKATPQQLYEAAVRMAGNSTVKSMMVLNGVGEGFEEGVQTVLESAQFGRTASLEQIGEAALMGALTGAGMGLGSALSSRSTDRRGYDRMAALNAGNPRVPSYQEWQAMSPAQRQGLEVVSQASRQALNEAAVTTANRVKSEMVAGVAGLDRLHDMQQQALIAERAKLNWHNDGTYTLLPVTHEAPDHTVVSSLNTTIDLMERQAKGLKEQAAGTEEGSDEFAQFTASAAVAENLLIRLRQAKQVFDESTTTDDQRRTLIDTMNAELAGAFEIADPTDQANIDSARAVSLTFLRNPADNSGSFQSMLPQISLYNTQHSQDWYIQIPFAPTQGMGADFDGDRATLTTRVELSNDALKASRTGRNVLGSSDSLVNVSTRGFEDAKVEMIPMGLSQLRGPQFNAAFGVFQELKPELMKLLSVNGVPFAEARINEYLLQLRDGDTKAKTRFFEKLALEHPNEMNQIADAHWTNPWYAMNTIIVRALTNYQTKMALIMSGATPATKSIVAAIPATSPNAAGVVARAVNFTHLLSWESLGSDLFRQWQSLHYSLINSPDSTDPSRALSNQNNRDLATRVFDELVLKYENINAAKTESDFDAVFGKDDIARDVLRSLQRISSTMTGDLAGQRRAMVLLANTMVPDLQEGDFRGTVTMLQWLLQRRLDREETELKTAGAWEADLPRRNRINSLRRLNAGEAMVEVLGGLPMYELTGLDSVVFGSNVTLAQFVDSYANQSDFSRREAAKQLKTHVSYTKKDSESGRHNLPYFLSDLQGPDAVTAYQSVVDAVLEAGNNVHTRIKAQSDAASQNVQAGVEALQQLARSLRVDVTSAQAWNALARNNDQVGRQLYALIPDDLVPTVFTQTSPTEVTVSQWVFEMLTKSPAEAEMMFFRHSLLAKWEAADTASMEDDSEDGTGRSYYKMKDRMLRLMYELSKDDRTSLYQQFQEHLLTDTTVEAFFTWLNDNVRGNEAAFTAWARDLSTVDPLSTQGGWSTATESSQQRERMMDFADKSRRLADMYSEQERRDESDALIATRFRSILSDPSTDGSGYIARLQKILNFSAKYDPGLAMDARVQTGVTSLMGLGGHTTDKGQSVPELAHQGVHQARHGVLPFGSSEEMAIDNHTASSVSDAANNGNVLAKDSFNLVDWDGARVDWQQLTPQRVMELFVYMDPLTNTYPHRARLMEILSPSVMALSIGGQLEQQTLFEPTMAGLLETNELADELFTDSNTGNDQYLVTLGSVLGTDQIEQIVNEYTHSYLSSRTTTLQSVDEAQALVVQTNRDLAKVVRMAARIAELNILLPGGSTVNQLDLVRQRVRDMLFKRMDPKAEILPTEERELYINALRSIVNPLDGEAVKRIDQLIKDLLSPAAYNSPVHRIATTFRVKKPGKGQSLFDWEADTLMQRVELVKMVLANRGLATSAHWGTTTLEKIWAAGATASDPQLLPKLTPDQWQEVSRIVTADQILKSVSYTLPGMENARLGNPDLEDWVRLHGTSFEYLADILNPGHPVIRAAIELRKTFDKEDQGKVDADGLVDFMGKSLLSPSRLDRWDPKIAQHIAQSNGTWIMASASPLGIGAAGSAPQNETILAASTARTMKIPDKNLRSSTTIQYSGKEALDQQPMMLTVLRPGGLADTMVSTELDGRFADEIWVDAGSGAAPVNLMVTTYDPGIEFVRDGLATDYRSITRRRLYVQLQRYAAANNLNLDQLAVTVNFLHPADQPETTDDANWANNLFFEGTVMETAADTFMSLDSAWFFAPGGIDQTGSTQALSAMKKAKAAWKRIQQKSHADIQALRLGWETDLHSALIRITDSMLHVDLGDGRRIQPEFRNAVFKGLKMRFFVRGTDKTTGEVTVLSAEQVIARQQNALRSGTTFDFNLDNLELYAMDTTGLRTLYGEQGSKGNPRGLTDVPDTRLSDLPKWRGIVTTEHLNRMPGLGVLEKRDFFDTTRSWKQPLRRYVRGANLAAEFTDAYDRGMRQRLGRAQEIMSERSLDSRTGIYEKSLQTVGNTIRAGLDNKSQIDGLRAAMGQNIDPKFGIDMDKVAVNYMTANLSRFSHQAGHIFRLRQPRNANDPVFGMIYGLKALEEPKKRLSEEIAANDPVMVDLEGLEETDIPDLLKSLRILTNAGATIYLSSLKYSELDMAADKFLRESEYKRVPGSSSLYEPKQRADRFLMRQTREDYLTRTRTIETSNLSAIAHSDKIDENGGLATVAGLNRRYQVAVDLVPTRFWPNHGLPRPQDIDFVRDSLAPSRVNDIIAASEKTYGKKMSKEQKERLTQAIVRARNNLGQDGLPVPGSEFGPGDLVPLVDTSDPYHKKIVFYRHGFKPPKYDERFEKEIRGNDIIIYSPEELPAASTRAGQLVRFELSSQYGLRAILDIPNQLLGDKLVVQGTGFKILAVRDASLNEAWRTVEMPEGIDGWPIEIIIGLADSLSKENLEGVVRSFRSAFTYLGFDFREDYAKFLLQKKQVTPNEIALVPQMLMSLKRALPKLTAAQVHELLNMDQLTDEWKAVFASVIPNAGAGVVVGPNQLNLTSTSSISDRLGRHALIYMMYEGSEPTDIMSSSGVPRGADSKMRGQFTREPNVLFTSMFENLQDQDPMRIELIQRLNKRIENNSSPLGWTIDTNFYVTFNNKNSKDTFKGRLQFAQLHSSGDNPVVTRLAQLRQEKQAASAQQTAVAWNAFGADTATSKPLEKTRFKSIIERTLRPAQVQDAESLIKLFYDVPKSEYVKFPPRMTFAERQYEIKGRDVHASFRVGITRVDAEWTETEWADVQAQRRLLAAKLGISGYESVIDGWIRQHLFIMGAKEKAEDGSDPGAISPRQAKESIATFTKIIERGELPLNEAIAPVMDPSDVKLLWEAVQNGSSQLKLRSNGKEVKSLRDWYLTALGAGDLDFVNMQPVALEAIDSFFHRYHELGMGFSGMGMSLYDRKAGALLDPATSELMMSVLPERALALSLPPLEVANRTLQAAFENMPIGTGRDTVPNSAMGQAKQKIWRWTSSNDMSRPVSTSYKNLLERGTQLVTRSTEQNGFLRTLGFMRDAVTLNNPMLWIGAPLEQFVESTRSDLANVVTGDALTSKVPGASPLSTGTQDLLRNLYTALGNNQKFKSMMSRGFEMETSPFNAKRIEMAAYRLARAGGTMQDGYYKMRSNHLAKRYVEAAINYIATQGNNVEITAQTLATRLSTNHEWLIQNMPDAHIAAFNTVMQQKNMKDNVITTAWRDLVNTGVTSKNLLLSTASTLMVQLPYRYMGYSVNKATQILGLEGVDQTLALFLHMKKKNPVLLRMQAAISGKPVSDMDQFIDMSGVIESFDLVNAFTKGAITHTSLFAFGMMAGSLGLSGEDEEDKRLRRIARAKGFAYHNDPRDLANDFRNADDIYLDWLPIIGDMFKVPNADGKGGSRDVAHMNWLMKQFLSPIIGMERFFATGNAMELWWGFEDAFLSFPLVNAQLYDDSFQVFSELANSALEEESAGTPESLPRAFNWWMKSIMSLERMLLENSFINMIYIAADEFDRDSWAKVDRTADGPRTNQLGIPVRSTVLRDTQGADGQVQRSYVGRDWLDATIHGYAENRATLALLGNIVSLATGADRYDRYGMVVKERRVEKDEATLQIAEAHIRGLYKGTLLPTDPKLEGMFVSLEMRKQIETRIKATLKKEGLALFNNEAKATSYMWDRWNGKNVLYDASGKQISYSYGTALKDVVYSQGKFEGTLSYKQSDKYYQLNTTYVMGPDGRPWATGLDRNNFLNLAGMMPLQQYIQLDPSDRGAGTDGRLNYVDEVRGINTGYRGLLKADESQTIETLDEKIADALKKAAADSAAASPKESSWVDYPSGSGSGWQNFGRRSYGGGGGGGGGGGSSARLQAPERQQVPYANDAQNINMSNPIIRRTYVRRERIGSERGRLKQWE